MTELELATGSKFWGTDLVDSDTDVCVVTIPTKTEISRQVFSPNNVLLKSTHMSNGKVDRTIISLPHLVHLVVKGSPNAVEIVYSMQSKYGCAYYHHWVNIIYCLDNLVANSNNLRALKIVMDSEARKIDDRDYQTSRKAFSHVLKYIYLSNYLCQSNETLGDDDWVRNNIRKYYQLCEDGVWMGANFARRIFNEFKEATYRADFDSEKDTFHLDRVRLSLFEHMLKLVE